MRESFVTVAIRVLMEFFRRSERQLAAEIIGITSNICFARKENDEVEDEFREQVAANFDTTFTRARVYISVKSSTTTRATHRSTILPENETGHKSLGYELPLETYSHSIPGLAVVCQICRFSLNPRRCAACRRERVRSGEREGEKGPGAPTTNHARRPSSLAKRT